MVQTNNHQKQNKRWQQSKRKSQKKQLKQKKHFKHIERKKQIKRKKHFKWKKHKNTLNKTSRQQISFGRNSIKQSNESAQRPDKKAGRAYGGNDGLAFELRAGAEKALRTGRAGGSIRSDLIFCFFSIKRKEVASAAMSGRIIVWAY